MLHSCQRRPRPLHKNCFHLNSSHRRHFPFKVAANRMGIGGGELFQAALANTQQREPEKRVCLEIQSVVANPESCSMLHIFTSPGRTETFSSAVFEPQRTQTRALCMASGQTKLTASGWEKYSVIWCKKSLGWFTDNIQDLSKSEVLLSRTFIVFLPSIYSLFCGNDAPIVLWGISLLHSLSTCSVTTSWLSKVEHVTKTKSICAFHPLVTGSGSARTSMGNGNQWNSFLWVFWNC